MSDKHLTELEWKRFAKGRGFKDGAFVKGLADLERAKAPDAQLSALAEIEKQSDLLLKAHKGDKELADYLGEAGKAIDKQRKLSEFEAKKTAKDGEDDDGPAALGAKMLPLLRQVAKGQDGGALPVMVAAAGKEVAVLVARRTIGPAQKKLLGEALGNAGGIKYMSGECVWEANAHTFVLEAKVANLAKGIKAALQKQTDVRFKVRVRGSDPHDVDDDGDDPQIEGDESGEEEETQESPEKAQYLEHLRELAPRLNSALHGETGDVAKLKALFGFAQGKAKEGHYAAALQGLDAVAKLLAGTGTVPPAPPLPSTTTVKPESGTGEPSKESKQFTERVNEMMPRIKDGLAAGMPGAGGAKLKLSEAAVFARKHDWQAANALLDELDKDLAFDGTLMPRTLSPKEQEQKELARKQELAERWRKTVPDSKALESMEEQVFGSGKPRVGLLHTMFEKLREENKSQDFAAALRTFASIQQAVDGSPEAARAEVRQMMTMDSPSYKERVDEFFRGQEPEFLEDLRRQAASEGYGLTSDGMVRYALPVSVDEWKQGALVPLRNIDRLVGEAVSRSRQNGRDPHAVLPLFDEIAGEQFPMIQLAERLRQYALDGSFTNRNHEEAALAIQQLASEFSSAVQPFLLMHTVGTDVDELLRSIEELAPTLKDYATTEDGGGTTPLEQLQQAIKDIRASKFGAASALLKSLRLEIESYRPEGEPGEHLNEQIASVGDSRIRDQVADKLFKTSNELDIHAANQGLPLDGVLSAFQKLDKAAKAFERML
ncbi:hypothetical protein SNE35_25875 [Paucibacter sp. R3-3]|uniref:GGDEF domain-containing protein n=1 Tax=Roseateles agri TaxID=3098619 RepID=A0ABU5DSD5_9BURK|nr:hypothetical protein [Paucibacter sp. R3-3]MDY0747957.1 hypothetical protein [Paucibacter sp. R3-3]